MKKNKSLKQMLILSVILIIIDQITKILIKHFYQGPIGEGFLTLKVIENTGMAFGWNSGNIKNIILTCLILGIIINFIRNQIDRIDNKTSVALSLILAGGISNLIDRIVKGGVIDFIEIKKFAIFNMADCYIVIGWVLLVIFLIRFNQTIVGEKKCEKK